MSMLLLSEISIVFVRWKSASRVIALKHTTIVPGSTVHCYKLSKSMTICACTNCDDDLFKIPISDGGKHTLAFTSGKLPKYYTDT